MSRTCAICGTCITHRSSVAKTCSSRCRKALSRRNQLPWVTQRSREFSLPERDFWRTPPSLFRALDREFTFTLDAATSGPDDSLCPEFLTPYDDALTCDWPVFLHLFSNRAAAFCNPPYSKAGGHGRGLLAWVEACIRAREQQDVVLVGPAETTSGWWHLALEHADEVRLPRKRVHFVPPPGLKPSSPRGGTVVCIFRRGGRGPSSAEPWTVPVLDCDRKPAPEVTPPTRRSSASASTDGDETHENAILERSP